MEGLLALLGAAGILLAIAANVTTIASFFEHRRKRRVAGAGRGAIRPAVQDAPSPSPVADVDAAAGESEAIAPTVLVGGAPAEPAAPTTIEPRRSRHVIRTPDQRVRVFVSSTLHELAEERVAARAAIEGLRLTPVLFELGARPHAPRDLYRAYLDQSDVFVGIYGQRYGWVAPGEHVSGLEDEYALSGDRPKLVYLKRQEAPREPRLEELIGRIQDDDHVSYRTFADARELRELLADDLATLLSERFAGTERVASVAFGPVPAVSSPLVGREAELERTCALLGEPGVRLVTLYGPGGIGKSRLALEVAHRARAGALQPSAGATCAGIAPDGVVYVGLEGVHDVQHLPGAIAHALGLQEDGADPVAAMKRFLSPLELLLVLDNFEQLLDGSPLLSTLLDAAPGLRMLVTSRALLRLTAERAVALSPLPLPAPAGTGVDAVAAAAANPAVQLFVWRARAVSELTIDARTAPILIDVVRRLDGWPLAIVLAASRVGHMSLAQLRDRLVRRLDVLVGGARDLPERQQTLRRTIEWSLEILSDDARRLLEWLGAFAGGATLEALERMSASTAGASVPVPVDALAELVDHSLVARVDTGTSTRYVMLEMIRETAVEMLDGSSGSAAVRDAHAYTFAEIASVAGPTVFHNQDHWFAVLLEEEGNTRLAIRRLEELGDVATLARVAGAMWLFWGMRGQHAEHLPWLARALERDDVEPYDRMLLLIAAAALSIQIGDYVRGEPWMREGAALLARYPDGRLETTMRLGRAIVETKAGSYEAAATTAVAARELAMQHGSPWAEGFANVMLARIATATGRYDEALQATSAAIRQMVANGDRQSEGWARASRAVALSLLGRHDDAKADAAESLTLFAELGYHQAIVTALRAAAFVYARDGDLGRATRLAGAAAAARERHGLTSFEPETSIIDRELDRTRSAGGASPQLDWEEGCGMPLDVAVRYALSGVPEHRQPRA